MGNVIRGLLKSGLAAGPLRCLVIGDSIEHPFSLSSAGVQATYHKVLAARVQRWPTNFWGCNTPILGQGDTGWPVSFSGWTGNANLSARVGPNSSYVRPGDTFSDSSTGHNLCGTNPGAVAGDIGNFGAMSNGTLFNTNTYQNDWESGKTLKATIIYRGSASSPAQWRLTSWTRDGSAQAETTQTQIPLTTNVGSIANLTSSWSRLTGSVYTKLCYVQSWNETETAGPVNMLSVAVEDSAPSSGMFWGYAGEGGYTTKTHLAAGESINPGGFGAFTAYYSDAALAANLAALPYRVFLIRLGQNSASDEWNGTSIGSYQANVLAIIARYRAACVTAGIANPIFILSSMYDADTDNTRYVLMSSALQAIALANPDCEFVDVRSEVQRQLGAYSSWQATYLADGIHPLGTMANLIVDYEWTALNGPTTGGGETTAMRTRLGYGRRNRAMNK